MNTYININGRLIEPPATLPERRFRGAWELDAKGVVGINPVKQREIFVDEVKAEAKRRILDLCPEWKQRNLTAQAAQLAAKGQANWTAEEQAEWDAGEVLWAAIKAIRARSDVLEQGPILDDVTLDSHWA